jgi:hypothetical protein
MAHPLAERLARVRSGTADELLEQFLGYAEDRGLTLYPAQEEAILELFAGKHVILATPTGSGKSLVATALAFRAVANGGRCFWAMPIKALVNEKFLQLCDELGADQVGMMTGDAALNTDAPVICCTQEIVASFALREGTTGPVDALVMDEFHFYGDRERGMAWHLPLLLLERTQFLLMSATIGDAKPFIERLEKLTKRGAVLVESRDRPVPLDFTYSEEPLHETVKDLVEKSRAPVYLVCFTQRACAEEAQALMSENYTSKEEKHAIAAALEGFRFDSPYGKEISRFVRHGIGLHHAGLLPKYRLQVEKLAQQGLLKVVCGTDTLGVGVNVPIRTVLFTKLCKFDGTRVNVLQVREFQQIAGRAGRKGFDVQGYVVAQAPEHVIENIKIDRKKEADPKKHKKLQRAKPPERGYAHWDKATFERLGTSKPEELVSRFGVTHGMVIWLLGNPDAGKRGGYGLVLDLIDRAHVPSRDKKRERKHAPIVFRSLRNAGIIELVPRTSGMRGKRAIVSATLQDDFSMHRTLGMWLLEFLPVLTETTEDPMVRALDVVSAVEAILESPEAILMRQTDKKKSEKIAELKAAGVEFDDRIKQIEGIEHDKPLAEVIWATLDEFKKHHPWASAESVAPKSIAREMWEHQASFEEYVREYDMARIEGLLLRYLSEVVKTLSQTVPEVFHTPELKDVIAFLRGEVRGIDASLLDEWEDRLYGPRKKRERAHKAAPTLAQDERALMVRVRRELHRLLRALAAKDWEAASAALRPEDAWDPKRIEEAMKPWFEVKKELWAFGDARKAEHTTLRRDGETSFTAWQALVDRSATIALPGDDDPGDDADGEASQGAIEVGIDLGGPIDDATPIIALRAVTM